MAFYALFGILVLTSGTFSKEAPVLEGSVKYAFTAGGTDTINVPEGYRIAFHITYLRLMPGEKLYLNDGPCEKGTPLLTYQRWDEEGSYGEAVNSTFFSTGELACVRYRSRGVSGGIQVDWRAFPRCRGKIDLAKGDIVNPTYPGPAPQTEEECEWSLRGMWGQSIRVEIREFQMPLPDSYLELRGVSGPGSVPKIKWINVTAASPRVYMTDYNELAVRYVSKPENLGRGFWIHFEALGCNRADLNIPRNGLWGDYPNYTYVGYTMYMTCGDCYRFLSGVGNRHYSLTCQEDKTWKKSWVGTLEDCVRYDRPECQNPWD